MIVIETRFKDNGNGKLKAADISTTLADNYWLSTFEWDNVFCVAL
jgi:hypothetical protein